MATHETLQQLSALKVSASFLNTSTIIALSVFFTLFCACIIIGHLIEENRWANESITALLLGLCAGGVVLLASKDRSSHLLVFNEDLFFLYLLPPIIFNAGFQVKKKQFFKNFTTMLLFGIWHTIGAILSATDSVCTFQVLSQDETPFLYSIVFGEGVVNDATSIVLFNAIQSFDFNNIDGTVALNLLGTFLYLYFTSTALGIVLGLLSAYIIKTLYFLRHSTDREGAPMMLMAYLSCILAELLNLSGILTIFFCGIIMSHYTWHSVTESSRITTKHAFATISFIAETFIFLYVFMDALDIDKWKASNARFLLIFFDSSLISCGCLNLELMSPDTLLQFSSSEDTSSQDSAVMITCTIIVVLFSTVLFGSITKPLIEAVLLRHTKTLDTDATDMQSLEDLRILFLENGENTDQGSNQQAAPRASGLRLLISYPTTTVHYFWRKFDVKFVRPVFGGRGFVPFVPSSPTDAVDEAS
ncbi:hypothetical protein WN944_007410 [Citrus x changshan-huyou]|uniref:Cation/H+ exchanger transmembrane domain-containing protein n=1 Tax=Citrus x changshan-huyou TaxID=2935761 RepID=A0AAP0MR50_9ROSI